MAISQSLFSFSLALLLSLLYSTATLAQLSPAIAPVKSTPAAPTASPPAALVPTLPQSPSDAAPDNSATDIVGILRKAKEYNILIRLMKVTQLTNQVNAQLAATKSGGLTILSPDDSAFSQLKPGFLNSLSDGQKLEFLQFHVLPIYVSSSNFDTLTNPVRTLAGVNNRLQLNVTSFGGSVNISTGAVNTTVSGIVYSDKRLAIYKVDKVLIPLDFVASSKAAAPGAAPELAPSIAPAPKPDKEKPSASESSDETSSQVVPKVQGSGTIRISMHGMWASLGVAFLVVLTI